jgi:hypothetical protein
VSSSTILLRIEMKNHEKMIKNVIKASKNDGLSDELHGAWYSYNREVQELIQRYADREDDDDSD